MIHSSYHEGTQIKSLDIIPAPARHHTSSHKRHPITWAYNRLVIELPSGSAGEPRSRFPSGYCKLSCAGSRRTRVYGHLLCCIQSGIGGCISLRTGLIDIDQRRSVLRIVQYHFKSFCSPTEHDSETRWFFAAHLTASIVDSALWRRCAKSNHEDVSLFHYEVHEIKNPRAR